jgi:hypothetical protein
MIKLELHGFYPIILWNGSENMTFTAPILRGFCKQTVTFTAKSINDAPVMKVFPSDNKEKQQSTTD